jgi:hypothetical protein
MGREKSRYSKVRVDILMLAGLHERMVKYSKEFKWSKTKIIEDALAIWLNSRDRESKDGLVKIK